MAADMFPEVQVCNERDIMTKLAQRFAQNVGLIVALEHEISDDAFTRIMGTNCAHLWWKVLVPANSANQKLLIQLSLDDEYETPLKIVTLKIEKNSLPIWRRAGWSIRNLVQLTLIKIGFSRSDVAKLGIATSQESLKALKLQWNYLKQGRTFHHLLKSRDSLETLHLRHQDLGDPRELFVLGKNMTLDLQTDDDSPTIFDLHLPVSIKGTSWPHVRSVCANWERFSRRWSFARSQVRGQLYMFSADWLDHCKEFLIEVALKNVTFFVGLQVA